MLQKAERRPAPQPVTEQPSPPRKGMVWVEGGEFMMGSNNFYPEEAPVRRVSVESFWIDVTPVTNRQLEEFVAATGWVTEAEIPANPADYPGAKPEMLAPASLVFTPSSGPVDLQNPANWWTYVPGANWRRPYGPDSSLDELADHPVVHVTWHDVQAYSLWAGADMPTEKEWEYAARGGLDGAIYAWGDALNPGGRQLANTWQGMFPYQNRGTDGWERTSPVGFYPANGYGLHDMIGNVWEWTSDWWTAKHQDVSGCCQSAGSAASVNPMDPCRIPQKVLKGGSHLCAPNYCRRYRPAARHPHPVDTSTSHIGFRCVVRPPKAS